jgi:curved DNA-binding protein CbpA
MVGDDLDIAGLIAEEVGDVVVPAPATNDTPLTAQLKSTRIRLETAENAFEVLGLDTDADTDTLRRAYMELASFLHPDKFTDVDDALRDMATETFDKVREAWDLLETEEKRQKYIDHVILGKPTEDEEAMEQVRAMLDAEADFKKGLAAFNAGRLTAAHKLFESAVLSAPEELEFGAYKAYTTFSLNRKTDQEKANAALENLREILDANQQQERRLDGGWVLLGRAYRESGDPESAERALVQALRYNPANPDAPRELRRLKGKQQPKDGGPKKGFFSKLFGKKSKK